MKNCYYILIMAILLQSCQSQHNQKMAKVEGKLEREQISITTKIPGKIEKILVQEGQWVQAGDTLVILEIPEIEAKNAQALGALDAAQAQYEMAVKGATDGQLKQLHAKVDGLKEQYDFANKSIQRMGNLLKDSLVSQQKYDEVYAKFQGAKNQYLAAQAELEEVKHGARIEQQKMALGQKERALGAVSEVNIAGKERYLIAAQAMSVETINLKVGELALAGYAVLSGYIQEGAYFRVTVPESQMDAFQIGTLKTLIFPYLNNKEIQAKVETVKALSGYASINTAYPDFEQQDAMFEVRLKPVDTEEIKEIITRASFQIK